MDKSGFKWMKHLKIGILTGIVIGSFLMSSLTWRHIETSVSTRVLVAAIILIMMYILIVFELVNRNLAALIGAAMSVAAYDCLIGYVSIEQIIQWEDLETLALLLGMMIIVNVLGTTGLFDYLAIWSYKQSGGQFWLLISTMSIVTAILSAFIDNVSTMLLMSPTLIRLSNLEHIDPRYMLMIMAVVSNIGGCATPVGDPPNLIIIGDPLMNSIEVFFDTFTAYNVPGVILCTGATLIYLKLVYKSKHSFREEGAALAEEKSGEAIAEEDQILAELRLLGSFRIQMDKFEAPLSRDSLQLKAKLDEQANQFEIALDEIRGKKGFGNHDRRISRLSDAAIDELLAESAIKSKPILIQSLAILFIAVLLFFVSSLPSANLSLGWASLFAGLSLLVVSSSTQVPDEAEDGHEDLFEKVVSKIEWSTLIFFFALFIVMEVMTKLGLIMFMGQQITNLIDIIPAGNLRSIGAITIILWASGLASACIDNVPFTSMMVKILGTMVIQARSDYSSQLSLKPLVFALSFGACLGGNGTLIGASANLVTAGISARYGYPLTFNGFFKFAAPITILTLIVSNIYLVLVFVVLDL